MKIDKDDKLIDVAEAAKLSDVSERFIWEAIRNRELRVVEVGPKSKKILLSELHRWWQTKAKRPVAVPEDPK